MTKNPIIALSTLALFGAAMLFVSAKSSDEPSIDKLSGEELAKWSNRNDTIFYKAEPVAIFEHYEYELNPNHRKPRIQAELCFIQVDDNPENSNGLVRYIYTLHPTSKVQIEFKDQYDKIKIWGERIK